MKRQKSELNTEQIVVRVSPGMKADIEAYCDRKGMSIAEWVRCCGAALEGEARKRDALRTTTRQHQQPATDGGEGETVS